MIICTCLVCGYQWYWEDDTDEDIIRASCAPCGHQGLFKVDNQRKEYYND
jgi:hypothetical protein